VMAASISKGICRFFLRIACILVCLLPGSFQKHAAEAHEIWFSCPQQNIKVGDTVRVEYGIGEVLFATPDEEWAGWMEQEIGVTSVYVVDPDGRKTPLEFKREKAVLAGSFQAEKKGTYLVIYVRENDFLTQTTRGWKRQKPEGLEGVIKSVTLNFYQKIIIDVEESSANYSREVGGLMEIVPIDDPSKAKVGDEIRFKVTYKGSNAPADVVVWGSYSEYSKRSHNWCYFGIPDQDGIVYFKPIHSGHWQLGAEKYLDEELLKAKQDTGIKPSYDAAVTFWVP
jgi:uncharacterized GH25 family protein